MSTWTTQHDSKYIHSPKKQKTSRGYVALGFDGQDDDDDVAEHKTTTMLKSRAYQEEMLAESLKRNVIVAMDTGSGKTQIAILRIREELWRCPVHKLVWFIAPTVVLAEQQYNVISQQLSAFQSKIITGEDNVDHWSSEDIWNAALSNIRIVVSTPQVLLDALTHSFVQLNRIALLVFDEAHHCTGSAPGNQILRDFYHHDLEKANGATDGLPHILGLTASPTTDGSETRLSKLENSLNAVCRSPKINREEMMQHVHRPLTEAVIYEYNALDQLETQQTFAGITATLDIEQDPMVKRLRRRNDTKSQKKLSSALVDGKTPCRKQIMSCFQRTLDIRAELGPWAADTFLSECRRRLQEKCERLKQQPRDKFMEWDYEDDRYMYEPLAQVPVSPERQIWEGIPDELSHKALELVKLLERGYAVGTRAILFAKERATVIMLTHLISQHPELKHVKPGAFLGTSTYASRKSDIIELTGPNDQYNAVDELRTGEKNLLVSTSVLEEGVDVPACDLVICFDPPKNLRSFVQRRGRARKEASKFFLFLNGADQESITRWTKLEKGMKDKYEDDMRELKIAQESESIEEEEYEELRIPSTGALLTLKNARSHLDHFCATIRHPFAECLPDFEIFGNTKVKLVFAKVKLPNMLDPQFRKFSGRSNWATEKMAQQDAAFQAYAELYKAGLVNDNLMPEHISAHQNIPEVDKRPSLVQLASPLNPWANVAAEWQRADSFHQSVVEVTAEAQTFPRMLMILPVPLPCDISFQLFWNEETVLTVSVTRKTSQFASTLVESAAAVTHLLLSSIFPQRMRRESVDFSCLFIPEIEKTARDSLHRWCESVRGTIPANKVTYDEGTLRELGMVKRLNKYSQYTQPLVAERYLLMKRICEGDGTDGDINNVEEPHIEGPAWPKRTDFLHPVMNTEVVSRIHTSRRCHPVSECQIDKLPATYARFSLFVPSVLHKIGNYLIAQELRDTILSPIAFENLNLVLTAISSSAAQEASNYQRIEFYGDCLLKLQASLQLAAKNPTWHEDLLSRHKDSIVSNTRLSKAAIETGLHKFIFCKAFTGLKWRPFYNSDHLGTPNVEATRELSTKVLADVVEALIGAAMIDGGHEKTLQCLRIFLPEVGWTTYESRIQHLYHAAESDIDNILMPGLPQVEELIGYEFTKKSLLLASFTHPSNTGPGLTYQRLEFIGDSILDSIVVQALFNSPREFPHYQMHLMRSTLVNADFLAFLSMNTSIDVLRGEVISGGANGQVAVTTTATTRKTALWEFMRHSGTWEISNIQRAASKRFEDCRRDICNALESSRTHPWTLLSHIGAGKFFSDLIESVLGAIFIDSQGAMDACHAFLERIGLMKYLRRVLSEDIDVMHPKERLGELAAKQYLKVDYRAKKDLAAHVEGDTGSELWKCVVQIGEEDMVEVDNATSRLAAETKAAEAALAMMRMRNCELSDVNVIPN